MYQEYQRIPRIASTLEANEVTQVKTCSIAAYANKLLNNPIVLIGLIAINKMASSGHYQYELHEHDPPFIRECDNRCGHRGTLEENWRDGSKWIGGKMFKYLNPMICDKCKKEFEEADRKEMEFEKLEISLTENN